MAHGLRWERRVASGDAVSDTGWDASTRGRVTMVTVTVSPGAVQVRSFGR